MKKILLFLLFVICYSYSFSQKQTNFWHFGAPFCGLDFNSGTPVVLSNSVIQTTEGSASISDNLGNLLFYTDGIQVFDKTNTQMPNGFGLLGDISTTQCLIVPNPGNSNLYYIFTIDDEGGDLNYSVVDMTMNSGNGDVSVKNTFLNASMTEKVCAVYHCNSHDIWVTVHDWNTNSFRSYLVTDTGINPPVVSSVGPKHSDVHGQMKFNTAGTKIACSRDTVIQPAFPGPFVGDGYADVFDFNNSTGVISNPVTLSLGTQLKTYGIEFSPDNSKLYVGYYFLAGPNGGESRIAQYDMNAGSINASKVDIVTDFNNILRSLQLGPDLKIYVAKSNSPFVCSIDAPNVTGVACNYVDNAINLDPLGNGNMVMLGLPGFFQSYFNPAFPTIPCQLSASVSHTDPLCFDSGNTGTASVTAIGGTTPFTYTWSTTPPQSSQSVSGLAVGTYSVTVTDALSAQVVATVTITNPAPPNINPGSNVTIPAGGSTNLNATSVSGPPFVSYTWSPTTGLSDPSVSNPTATPTVNTTYCVTGTTANGCQDTKCMTVTISGTIPTTSLTVVTTFTNPLCNNENTGTATATVSGGTSPYTYSWSTTPIQTGQTATGLVSGSYIVTVRDFSGTQFMQSVTLANPAAVTIDAGEDITLTQGSSVTLNATGNNVVNYSWSPVSGLSNPLVFNPVATPALTTEYIVTGSAANGCSVSDTLIITLAPDTGCSYIFIPNAFSPNGDVENDMLFVRSNCLSDFVFAVFDRWGEKVFETNVVTKGWDGTYLGKPLDPAVFFYSLSGTYTNGEEAKLKGDVSLIR